MKSLLLISIIAATGSTARSWHLARDDLSSELHARHIRPDGVYSGQFLKRSGELPLLTQVLSRRGGSHSSEEDLNSRGGSALTPPPSPWSGAPREQGNPSSSRGGSSGRGQGSSGIEYFPNGWSTVPFDQVDFSKKPIHISKAGPMPDFSKPLPGPTAEHRVSPDRGRGNLGASGSAAKSKLSTTRDGAEMKTPGRSGGRRPGPDLERGSSKSQSSGGSPKAQGSSGGSSRSKKIGH